jgi:putative ABC transport system permease protein
VSATLRDRGVRPGPPSGGVPARRAVVRWAWRLFRREWRQQILVLALLILTVAAAAFSVSAAYNVASLPGPQFGSANHLLQFDGTNPGALTADIAAARNAFGTIQVIGHRFVPIPGSTQTVEFRAESPHGPYSGPMLALTEGRFPARPGQVAVTGPLAQTLQLRIGSALSLDGHQTVTGIVENPSDLNDEFALVSPSGAIPPQSVTVLLNAGPASFEAFRAAVAGTAAGLAVWIAAAPGLDTFAGHRIDRFAIPWDLVALGMLLAVVTATGAAWWPARAAARLPVTLALSARPPRPRPAHRPALLAALMIVAGVACLGLGNQNRPPLIIAGAVAMTLGILFISPLAIRALAAPGRRAPVAVRLALRDLARHQARSGAALAAISLALGITAAIIISSAADKTAANAGNLPDTQILVWTGLSYGPNGPVIPLRTPAQLRVLAAAVHQIAGPLPHSEVTALDMPVNPADKPQPGGQGSQAGQPVASLGAPQNPAVGGRAGTYSTIPLYVATPAVLRYLGISPATITPAADFLTVQAGQLVVNTPSTFATATHVQRIQAPSYASQPTSLMTLGGLHRRGWTQMQSGWLVQSGKPLTAAQLAAARDVAAKAGLIIEARNNQASLATISAAATAAGALLALGVLAMTVGLIRTEAAGDLRTLTAAGATSTTRRTLTAVTAGALALLGALLGSASAYLALAAGHLSDLGSLSRVPVLYLAITILGVPVAATLTGWILAGRQPPSIARQMLE